MEGGRGKLTVLTLCEGPELSSHLPARLPWANNPIARSRTSQFLLHNHGPDALSISQRVYSLCLKPSWDYDSPSSILAQTSNFCLVVHSFAPFLDV